MAHARSLSSSSFSFSFKKKKSPDPPNHLVQYTPPYISNKDTSTYARYYPPSRKNTVSTSTPATGQPALSAAADSDSPTKNRRRSQSNPSQHHRTLSVSSEFFNSTAPQPDPRLQRRSILGSIRRDSNASQVSINTYQHQTFIPDPELERELNNTNSSNRKTPSIYSISSASRHLGDTFSRRNSRIRSSSQDTFSSETTTQPNRSFRLSMSRQRSSSDVSVGSGSVPDPAIDLAKNIPHEMMPILTLLHAQKQRTYYEGYFMILNDLNSDGKPSAERKWVEVFGKLSGTVFAIWDADSLERNASGSEPSPTYINITDSTFKPIASLPSPSGNLSDIIVLSTTLKNRYLLQFANSQLLKDWTAAFRLALFEYTSLQEAYTGALLSAKGAKLNGIRTLLHETKFYLEDWVSVRFGAGMPWKRCWTVVAPSTMKKKKGMPLPGTIAFYEDKKKMKKPPLALITGAYATYAIYPQNSVLINNSTLIKVEGKVAFNDVEGEKDASVFLMPEAHPGVPGFETLIRFLIPVLDVFRLYGRPSRLNADKADLRSLLFAMPTLPFTQYLEFADAQQLTNVNGSENWTAFDWTKNIKDHLHKKISNGYKGCGRLQRSNTGPPTSRPPITREERDRSVSSPVKMMTSAAPTMSNTSFTSTIGPSASVSSGTTGFPAAAAAGVVATAAQPKPQQNAAYSQGLGYPLDGHVPNNAPRNGSQTSLPGSRPQGPSAVNTSAGPLPGQAGPITPTAKSFDHSNYSTPTGPPRASEDDMLIPPAGYVLSPQNSGSSYRSVNSGSPAGAPRTPNFSRPPNALNNNGSNGSLVGSPYSNAGNNGSNPAIVPGPNSRPPLYENENGRSNSQGLANNYRQNLADGPQGPRSQQRPPQGQPPMNRPPGPNGPQPMNRPPQQGGQQQQQQRPPQQFQQQQQQQPPQYPGGPRPPQGQFGPGGPQQASGPRPQQFGPTGPQQGVPQNRPPQKFAPNGPQQTPGPRPPQQYGPGGPQQGPGPRPPQQFGPGGPQQGPGPRPPQQQHAGGPRPMQQGVPRGPVPNALQPSGPRPLQQYPSPQQPQQAPMASSAFDPTATIPNHNHTVGERTYAHQQYSSLID